MKEYNYMKALSALREGRNTNNPAHKDAFNSLISDLKKKNPHWGRKSIADYGSTTRALFKAVSFVTIIKQTVARFLSIY